jgi:dinuclear metal center YbgI/SA1388 family protein
MASRDEIVAYLDERLDIRGTADGSSNGLQVAGAEEITRLAVATDAAMATYRAAVERGCQMLFVHHGLIWGGIERVAGRERDHLKLLLDSELNLYAAHLPLDLHPELGNNAQLAETIGLVEPQPFGDYRGVAIGFSGTLKKPLSNLEMATGFQARIGGTPENLPFGPDENTSVGIVSGGGSSTLREAVDRGLDCFVTGEGRHEDHHLALEGEINVLYLGHYHSETLGVRAVGRELEQRFGVEATFIDEPTRF